MYCIKSHIHFQVSPSASEIFKKNLKIGRFYPGLPYVYTFMSDTGKPKPVLTWPTMRKALESHLRLSLCLLCHFLQTIERQHFHLSLFCST